MATRVSRLVALSVVFSFTAGLAAPAYADNVRRDWYKAFDYNGDKRLKGKEVRHFKKDHLKQWENLREWCDAAKEKPKKHEVDFPKDVKEKKFKCKKYRVDEPYIKAWIKAAKPDKKDKNDEKEKEKSNEEARKQ